jgi:hypothetical protein
MIDKKTQVFTDNDAGIKINERKERSSVRSIE